MLFTDSYPGFMALAALLGAGTALVYPTFLAAVAEHAPAPQRARSVGIFRFWRDMGYAVGAVLTGVLADWLGPAAAAAGHRGPDGALGRGHPLAHAVLAGGGCGKAAAELAGPGRGYPTCRMT